MSFLNPQIVENLKNVRQSQSSSTPTYKDWKKENIVTYTTAASTCLRKQVTFQQSQAPSPISSGTKTYGDVNCKIGSQPSHSYQELTKNSSNKMIPQDLQTGVQLAENASIDALLLLLQQKLRNASNESSQSKMGFSTLLTDHQLHAEAQATNVLSASKAQNKSDIPNLLPMNTLGSSDNRSNHITFDLNKLLNDLQLYIQAQSVNVLPPSKAQVEEPNQMPMNITPKKPTTNQKIDISSQNQNQVGNHKTLADLYSMILHKDNISPKLQNTQELHDAQREEADLNMTYIFQIMLKQQEQLTTLQQQVNQLIILHNKENQLPKMGRSNTDHNSVQSIGESLGQDEIIIGEEASNTPVNNIFRNKPADWAFYGNTLEQVIDVLQKSPTAPERPHEPRTTTAAHLSTPNSNNHQMQKVFQVSHIHGANFTDVNVSATQRVTFGTHPAQHYRHLSSATLPLTDRSIAMNSLALKYLPNEQLPILVNQPSSIEAQILNKKINFKNKSLPIARPTDMSTTTFNYMAKYDLLNQNKNFSLDK